jgi:tRNA(Phe) wybutosine-synthesizing methylase Tyw3
MSYRQLSDGERLDIEIGGSKALDLALDILKERNRLDGNVEHLTDVLNKANLQLVENNKRLEAMNRELESISERFGIIRGRLG